MPSKPTPDKPHPPSILLDARGGIVLTKEWIRPPFWSSFTVTHAEPKPNRPQSRLTTVTYSVTARSTHVSYSVTPFRYKISMSNTSPTQGLVQALYNGVDFDILPTQLEPHNVDHELWSAVSQINQSGWAWTRYSCAGQESDNPYEWAVTPYMQIIVHRDDLTQLMNIAQGCVDRAHTGQVGFDVSVELSLASSDWWAVTVRYIDSGTEAPKVEDAERGQTMLFDLAEQINPSRQLRLVS